MRINIEFITPWVIGGPLKSWAFHKWSIIDNHTGKIESFGVNLVGFYFSFSKTATWSGVSVSVNLFKNSSIKAEEVKL